MNDTPRDEVDASGADAQPYARASTDAADAVRYAIVKRLAPGLRHALMGDLQAVQMSAQLAARLVPVSAADPTRLIEKLNALPHLCAELLLTGNAIFAWLHPDPHATTTVAEGVKQCTELFAEDRLLREIVIVSDLQVPEARVPEAAFRELGVVALLVLADASVATIDIDIVAQAQAGDLVVTLRTRAADREPTIASPGGHRAFAWRDVEVLADAHHVASSREANGMSLRFGSPRAKRTLAEALMAIPKVGGDKDCARVEDDDAPRTDTSTPEVTHVSRNGFWLLVGNEALLLPFDKFPWFKKATIEQLEHVEWPAPNHVYWPQLDVDLSVESIRNPELFPLVSR